MEICLLVCFPFQRCPIHVLWGGKSVSLNMHILKDETGASFSL